MSRSGGSGEGFEMPAAIGEVQYHVEELRDSGNSYDEWQEFADTSLRDLEHDLDGLDAQQVIEAFLEEGPNEASEEDVKQVYTGGESSGSTFYVETFDGFYEMSPVSETV